MICSAYSSLCLKILLFFSFHIWYIKAFQSTFNRFVIKTFPFNLFTAHTSSPFQPSTSLLRPHRERTPLHIVLEKEHAKKRWSLDSCSCLQRLQIPSMSIPHALSWFIVWSRFKIAKADPDILQDWGEKFKALNISVVSK